MTVRYIELSVAVYIIFTGLMMIFSEMSFSYPVYDPWRDFGLRNWGLLCAFIGALHLAALWWNGRSRLKSRVARTVGCAGHLTICISFSSMFAQSGAYWALGLFACLLPLLIIPISYRVVGEVKGIKQEVG